jgi:pimeloyl-ACP methyl ester carboxylesterase
MFARVIGVALSLILLPELSPLRAEPVTPPLPPIEVKVRPGVTIKYLALSPQTKPRNAVILFAGGNGLLNLQADGSIASLSGNFLVRSREQFVQSDLFVAVADTPNQVTINGNVRLSAQYAQDLGHVIADVRGRIDGGKVWLIGTSTGTMSAASVAARLPLVRSRSADNLRRPDGVVLTATQTNVIKGHCGRTVFNAQLAAINVPVLVAHHLADACECSPPKLASRVVAALAGAPAKELITFSGGLPPKSPDACMARTPHGFLGLEDKVVTAIAGWIRAH